ncbi:MAG: hypothetical protein HLUCCA11_20370 [Phormidesmis priestleyi Ana]|uniref:Uncharacterized protein n=1 Tax=Phormidesmis priestleyi Ana TaxID=1666911 RepID=A0A0N8KM64_9CYAN|nr:MAG: hypothetical protein HLUCCA11_20370 [Phormidesmis priestleyi Ana]
MKLWQALLISFTFIPFALIAMSLPANAKDIAAQGAAQQKTPIAVEIGAGHTIDFSQTGQQVFRAWIGDGGRCLLLSPSSPLENGASIIYLRRISPCQQISGLPDVDETTLTLVTLSPAGDTHIYEFSIDYSSTGDSLTRLVPQSALDNELADSLARELASERLRSALLQPTAVAAGLATFNLGADNPVVSRVNAWLEAVDDGQNQQGAAQDVALDWRLLERLEDIGRNQILTDGAADI